ncbi:MAG: transposase, partial [Clostridiales bacterium]|nr:transposase [Clostridiales bacterium]
MPKRNYTPEQIIVMLRKVEVLCGQGMTVEEAVRAQGITENTYYKWRKQYSGMDVNAAARL